jgi:WD40 repeat protein
LAVAFAPAGDMLATGGWDGTARVWSVDTGVELATFKGHGDKVNAVAFAPTPATAENAGHAADEGAAWSPIPLG